MPLASLFLYLMLNMFRMLIYPSSGGCDLFIELFHGLYCSGSMCVGFTLWFGCGGVVSGCGLKHYQDDARSNKRKIIYSVFGRICYKIRLGGVEVISLTGVNLWDWICKTLAREVI